jgi:hypothetical protein
MAGVMSEREFWADMQRRFSKLGSDTGDFDALWIYIVGSAGSGEWRVHTNELVGEQFDRLARLAGRRIGASTVDVARDFWLDAVKGKLSGRVPYEEAVTVPDGGEAIQQSVTISTICAESAYYCGLLESEAFEAEQTASTRHDQVQTPDAEPTARTGVPATNTLDPEAMAQSEQGAATTENRKGDAELLRGKDRVTIEIACQYLGITRRAVEKAIQKDKLESDGEYQNRRILTASLLRYLPPTKNAN